MGGTTGTTRAKREKKDDPILVSAALGKAPVEVLDFFLPLWAGAMMHASPAQIGLLTAAEAAASFLVRPIAGILADRFHRDRIAAAGAVLYTVSFLGYALTPGIGPAYAAAVVGGAGGALFWVALRARIGERLDSDGGAYGTLLSWEGTGALIGYLAAFQILGRWGYRWVFAACAVSAAVAGITLLAHSLKSRARPRPAQDRTGLRLLAGRLSPLLAVAVVTATAEAGIGLLLLIHLQQALHLEIIQIALVFLPGFVVWISMPEYAHRIAVRIGRIKILVASLVMSACLAGSLAIAPHPVVIAVLWGLAAGCLGAAIPAEQSAIAEASSGRLGRGMGLYESATLLGGVIGPAVFGAVYGAGGWVIACVIAAVVLVGGAAAVPLAMRRVGVPDKPKPSAADAAPELEPEPESAEAKASGERSRWAIHAAWRKRQDSDRR